jgi:hypothetical protein
VSLEEELVEWSGSRPAWQRSVLLRLANGEQIGADDVRAIALQLVQGASDDSPALAEADLPGGGGSGACIRLHSLQPVAHVNALLDGQVLKFEGSGVTVVYGDNASGKSGYARLVKKVVRARHQPDVLTNIFEDRSSELPAATVEYEVDGVLREEEWPGEANPLLGQIGFYDEACGEAYISTESAVTYRPSALVLLDGLIVTCDAVRDALDALLQVNAQRRAAFPTPEPGSDIRIFLDMLSTNTTSADIDIACAMPADADDEIARLVTEAARLQGTDPVRERARLTDSAAKLLAIATHLDGLASTFGVEADTRLVAAHQRATALRAAALVASSTSFEDEPVTGIGSDTWRALWEAARQFSESEAYPDHDYPHTDPEGRCVLCQQELSPEAAGRFHRFQTFMADDTERQAADAQRELDEMVRQIRECDVLPSSIAVGLTTIESTHKELVEQCRASTAIFGLRKAGLLGRLDESETSIPEMPASGPISGVRAAAECASEQASTIDTVEFQRMLTDVVARRAELQGRREAAAARSLIDQEVERLKERATLEAAKRTTATTGITLKSTELARNHVTALVRDRFTRESHDLRLDRITLQDTGGHKGQLHHRPAFLGASQDAAIGDVLSEGEKTALGLAGFLTEAKFDKTHSAIVLDDPVTSLDHIRRSYVARRLCQLATNRQVVVFTHDVAFVGELRKAAEVEEVTFTERAVERRADGSVGICTDKHPWNVRDAAARLGQLEAELAHIKRDRAGWDAEMYDKEAADWAGKMSETWERIINLDIIGRVVDRGTSEVRPRMFRMLARITDEDDREFQQSYARCSQWARRHDKSPEVGYVAPDVAEMESELTIVRAWYDRVRRYAS